MILHISIGTNLTEDQGGRFNVYQMKNLHPNFGIALPADLDSVSSIKNIYLLNSGQNSLSHFRDSLRSLESKNYQSKKFLQVSHDQILTIKNNPGIKHFRIPPEYKKC